MYLCLIDVLTFQDVSLVDAGTYTCFAQNSEGETDAWGQLVVRRKYLKMTVWKFGNEHFYS